MKQLAVLICAMTTARAITIGTAIAECKTVARKFSNTCSGAPDTAATWASFTGSAITCTQRKCPDGVAGTACTWSRKLCVTCYTSGSDVMMRIQTNGLPDHCFSSPYPVTS